MKILKSLIVIVAVAALAAGATSAIFSSRAELDNNTITAGTLEIRIDGQKQAAGFTIPNMEPDKGYDKTFTVMNYGAPWFAGPSTLTAHELSVTAQKTGGSQELYDALWVQLYANAGWGGCSNPAVEFVAGKGCEVYEGPMSGLNGDTATDILHATQWGTHAELIPGNSLTMTFDVLLPWWAPSELMGQTTMFDLYVDGYIPHRIP